MSPFDSGSQSNSTIVSSSQTRKKSYSVTSSSSSGSRKSAHQRADKSLHLETGGGDAMMMNIGGAGSNSSSGKSQSIEETRDAQKGDRDQLKVETAAQRALEALKDFDISGISLLKEHDNTSFKSIASESSSSSSRKYSLSIEVSA